MLKMTKLPAMKKRWIYLIIVLVFNSLAVIGQIPTNGLICYYPFNGNANDESNNGNDGTVYGASLTYDKDGNPNSAYYFDGINDYIDCGNNPIIKRCSTSYTVCFWINLTDYSSGVLSSILSNRYKDLNDITTGSEINIWGKYYTTHSDIYNQYKKISPLEKRKRVSGCDQPL